MDLTVEENPFENEDPFTHTWTDEETDEEETSKDNGAFVEGTEGRLSPQSDRSSNWDDECVDEQDGALMGSGGEGRMLKLRRNLHQLDSLYAQKELRVLKAREELRVCCLHLAELQGEREALEELIDREKQEENSVGVFRMRAQHKRVCEELHREEELQALISMALREHELELYQVEVKMAGVCDLHEEQNDQEQKKQERRLHLEKTKARAHHKRIQQDRAKKKAEDEQERAAQLHAQEQSKTSQRKASQYIRETINRIQRMESEKEERSREEVKRRTDAVLSLKNNIAASQEALRVQRARAHSQAQRRSRQQDLQTEALQIEGGNTTRELHQQRVLNDQQRRKEELEDRQRARRMEIVSKLLQEEEVMEKRKQQQAPPLPAALPKGAHRTMANRKTFEKILQKLEPVISEAVEHTPVRSTYLQDTHTPMTLPTQPQREQLRGMSDTSSDESSEEEGADSAGEEEEDEEEESGSDESLPETGCSLEELAARPPVKERHPVVACRAQAPLMRKKAGRGFKGPPFISKPAAIHFKDFDIGRVYRKRITLTNVTYSTNYCKLLGISTHLMDFISLSFQPPGPMSPGMTCEMEALFKPVLNEDLEGEVCFSSAAGSFSVPVRCTTKKCQMVVDSSLIEFGSHVVGQTISRVITLSNRGARGTRYFLLPSASSNHTRLHTPSHASSPSTKMPVSREESVEQILGESRGAHQSPDSPAKHSGGSPATLCVSVCGEEAVCVDSPIVLTQSELDQLSDQHQQHQQNQQPEPEPSPHFPTPDSTEPSSDTATDTSTEIQLPQVREGEVGPFGSTKIHITFNPTIPGDAHLDFQISFSEPDCQAISVSVSGTAVTAPVCVTQPDLDLKICSYGRLYQQSITVQSRANRALHLVFNVCKELRNHMEILPKTAYVQARSTFQAQFKFLPRRSLPADAGRFFDKETGVMEVPLSVQVADQVRPIPIMVHAVVTTSDLEFEHTELDFGHCSVRESVKLSLRLTNRSLLPQDFGFLGVPKCIDVQPGDGFGTLLPLETLELDVMFSPQTAGDYSFQLTCRTGANRVVCVQCRGVGVQPVLELSHTLVEFRATAVGSRSSACLYVLNTHTSTNQFTHNVPRVGPGPPAPIGPRRFAFCPPNTTQLTVTPTQGRVLPGERCLVQVTFTPSLSDDIIKAEASRLLAVKQQQAAELSSKATSLDTPVQPTKKEALPEPKKSRKPPVKKNSKAILSPKTASPPNTQQGGEELGPAVEGLLRSFKDTHQRFIVPCFVSDGDATEPEQDCTYSPHNILYLELRCPVVRPALLLLNHSSGYHTINYQQVLLDEKVVKKVTVQNICEESLDLTSSVLDLSGPFLLLNALRSLRPGDTYTLLLAFTPTEEKKYREVLEVRCSRMNLELTLCGEGVKPLVTCTLKGPVMDFGYVLENDSASQIIKLHNGSVLSVKFTASLASPPPTHTQQLSVDQSDDIEQAQNASSTTNGQSCGGRCAFLVSPAEGAIPPGKSMDVTVTFQPDHESLTHSDTVTIQLSNKQTVCAVDLKGASRHNIMYLCGGDPLKDNLTDPTQDVEKAPNPVLLILRSDGGVTASRSLEVGCIRTSQPGAKKSVEFVWENAALLKQKGFSVEPPKGNVDAGARRTLTVTWAPPKGTTLDEVVEVTTSLTLKGNETEVYSVTLQALPPQPHSC
ncbi:cilia- and flagella-associated protein 74 isoform X2 [Alosa sapidissima]|uniref:cilia- and flagella-associated protein 74 isoform X2 n=1 Tax=Alosa sapidissima TaxID=34773 RepID=UPI001C08DE97|nr:cilia- and flagella-associated protein 74 isoform X2 [Alosa sapidissima]